MFRAVGVIQLSLRGSGNAQNMSFPLKKIITGSALSGVGKREREREREMIYNGD